MFVAEWIRIVLDRVSFKVMNGLSTCRRSRRQSIDLAQSVEVALSGTPIKYTNHSLNICKLVTAVATLKLLLISFSISCALTKLN